MPFEYYLVRHGARAPLLSAVSDDIFLKIFGVANEELTAPGKSQAYFYGRELRLRHPDIKDEKVRFQSTNVSRTRMTAEYFIKGWKYPQIELNSNEKQLVVFRLNPDFLPPCSISFNPQEMSMNVSEQANQDQIQSIPMVLYRARSQTAGIVQQQWEPVPKQEAVVKLAKLTNKGLKGICHKAERTFPGACKHISHPASALFVISDIENCMSYIGKHVPNLTKEEIQIAHLGPDISYGRRFGVHLKTEPSIANFFRLLLKFHSEDTKQLVVQFTHDVIIFGVIRVLLGYGGYRSMFEPHLIMPFLSSLHFQIHDNIVSVFFNDVQLRLPGCELNCTIEAFRHLISRIL